MIKTGASRLGILFLNGLSLFPLSVLYLIAHLSYLILYHLIGYRRKVVKENLMNAFPEKNPKEILNIEKQYYKHLTALMVEILKMSTISRAELNRRFRFRNLDRITAYLDSGTSVLACSAHYGNWEWGTLALGLHIRQEIYPIYKPVSNAAFGQWFNRIRSRFGNHLIPMRQTLRALQESRDRPTLFLFGNDQTPLKTEATYWMSFLNQQTAILPGLEKIAIRTNRPVFYLKSTVLKKGYYEVDCVPLCLNPESSQPWEITNLHVRMLENIIQEDPPYWLWSHRRWKHKPDV